MRVSCRHPRVLMAVGASRSPGAPTASGPALQFLTVPEAPPAILAITLVTGFTSAIPSGTRRRVVPPVRSGTRLARVRSAMAALIYPFQVHLYAPLSALRKLEENTTAESAPRRPGLF